MAYALRTSAGPIELDPSQPVRIGRGEGAITYVVPWNGGDLVAAYPSQVGAITEPDPVPGGKMATGYSLSDDGTTIRRVLALVDAPVPTSVAVTGQPAMGGITVASGVVTLNPDATGLSSAIRVTIGRYRVYFDAAQPDSNYIPILTVRDAADRRARLSAKTTAYVEVKTLDQTGAAADAQEIGIIVNRVSWT